MSDPRRAGAHGRERPERRGAQGGQDLPDRLLPAAPEQHGAHRRHAAGIQLEDLGIDYINRRNGYIEAVTIEDARRVARRLYRPDRLTVVVVGRPDGIEPTREAPDGGS